jgi:hypothetical protein
MAYYVTTDGVDQTIDAPGFLFPSTGIIRIAVDRELFTGGGGIQITTPSSGSIIFYSPASNYFQISFTGTSQFMFGAGGYTFVRGEQAIELDFDLGVIRCYGGASSALLGTFTATSVLSSLGGTTSTSLTWGKRLSDYSQSDVYAFQILENAVLVRDYDPSLSNGTGLVVPESLGGTSASLINYNPPNDDSQWVFYGSGGATYTLTLDPGSYIYTGNDSDLLANRNVLLDSGSYAYTGNDADFIANRNVLFNAGSYLYTGNSADLLANRNVSFDAGNYIYSGNNVNLAANRNVSFDPSSYSYTGQDLTLTYTPTGGATYTINLDPGTYQIAGSDIILAANRAILLDSGNYSYTGESVILATNRRLSLEAGSYAVTGNDVSLLSGRKMLLDAGAYTYAGSPITLVYSGQIISLIDDYSVNYANETIKATYSNEFITARF